MTVAAIGVIAAPVLAAIGALAAFVGQYTIVIEKSEGKLPLNEFTHNDVAKVL